MAPDLRVGNVDITIARDSDWRFLPRDFLPQVAREAWLPYVPFWAILMIFVAISVIWALTAHGRDVAT